MLEELLTKKVKLEKGIDNPNINASQREAMIEKLQDINAQLAALESPKGAGKSAKQPKEPKPAKEPKAKPDPAIEVVIEENAFANENPEGEMQEKIGKMLDCEEIIAEWRKDKKNRDAKWKESTLIERVMRSKEHKGKHTKEELKEKTVPELRTMLGLVKPPKEKMQEDTERVFQQYTKRALAIEMKNWDKAKVDKNKSEIMRLEKEYSGKIAEQVAKLKTEFISKVSDL